jgi:4-amino-4-deoxy-L-arabinose transferase-like glycosyltransferase
VDRARVNLGRGSWLTWLILVLVASACLRLAIVATTPPLIGPDTPGYTQLAERIAHLNLSGDRGERTPTYPLFILMLGQNAQTIRAAQMILGMLVTAAVFWMVWALSRNAIAAAAASSLYGLNLMQIFYEAQLLTEALATFLVTMSAALMISLWADRERWVKSRLALTGICIGLLALERPVYILLPSVFVVPLLLWLPGRRRLLVLFLLPASLPWLGWSVVNQVRFDTFGPTTLAGLELTNKTGGYMQDAPSKFAAVRDIYVRARDANHGRYVDLIWHVQDEMMSQTGQTHAQLSRTFMSINIYLITHHPVRYAEGVFRASVDFWKGMGYRAWLPGPPGLARVVWLAEKVLVTLASAVFLLLVGLRLAVAFRSRTWPVEGVMPWLAVCVLLICLACALIESGSNARFGMPTEPLVFVVAVSLLATKSLRPTGARLKKR